jgi:uncharacterized membrane protein YphA (DoxX/SURF4 family)
MSVYPRPIREVASGVEVIGLIGRLLFVAIFLNSGINHFRERDSMAAFLLPAAFYMHAYWKVEDPQMRTMQMHHFFKNVSMFGASLTLFYVFTECGGDLGLMAGGTLF